MLGRRGDAVERRRTWWSRRGGGVVEEVTREEETGWRRQEPRGGERAPRGKGVVGLRRPGFVAFK
jgi:hypothetical protein